MYRVEIAFEFGCFATGLRYMVTHMPHSHFLKAPVPNMTAAEEAEIQLNIAKQFIAASQNQVAVNEGNIKFTVSIYFFTPGTFTHNIT